jgi:hypothetical protein
VNLTEHFTLEELTASQVAVRRGIDNSPSPDIVKNLSRLAATLERVRAWVSRPIAVSSGYRCVALNALVGGAANSAHRTGLAADITCSGIAPKALAVMIRDSGIEFDQLIYEGTWVHIGLSVDVPRRQVLTAHFGSGSVTYSKGIL